MELQEAIAIGQAIVEQTEVCNSVNVCGRARKEALRLIVAAATPKTCETCKWWYGKEVWGECLNPDTEAFGGIEPNSQQHKDFGCIHWDGRE